MHFSESHEWIDTAEGTDLATVGISDHAQKELGEIVYVELPRIGKEVKAGEEAAVLESTKAAADVYSPASGVIIAVNDQLSQQADLINKSPEKNGWIFKIKLTNPSELNKLLSSEQYYKQFQ